MIKAVIFDLDGTLAYTLSDLATSTNYALEMYGFPIHEKEKYKQFIGSGAVKLVERALPENKRDEETVSKVLNTYKEHYAEHFMDESMPYDNVCEMLEVLKNKGIKLCVLSNKPDVFTQPFMKKVFSKISFDIVMGNSDKFPTKPNPASINYIAENLGFAKNEFLYVGDSDVDVITAHNADIECVGVSWGYRGRKELIDAGSEYVIDSPKELINIIEKKS